MAEEKKAPEKAEAVVVATHAVTVKLQTGKAFPLATFESKAVEEKVKTKTKDGAGKEVETVETVSKVVEDGYKAAVDYVCKAEKEVSVLIEAGNRTEMVKQGAIEAFVIETSPR